MNSKKKGGKIVGEKLQLHQGHEIPIAEPNFYLLLTATSNTGSFCQWTWITGGCRVNKDFHLCQQ